MIVVGGDAVLAQEAMAGALAEINRLEPLLSGWDPHSELSRLNTVGRATVSPELFRVIEAAEAWRRDSGGAFDGRLGAVEALWRQAATEQSFLMRFSSSFSCTTFFASLNSYQM